MLVLTTIAFAFIAITAHNNRLLFSLYLIYIAFFSNSSTLSLNRINISSSSFYLLVTLIIIVLQKFFKLEPVNYSSFLSSSKSIFFLFVASFILPFLWNIFYFNIIPIEFFTGHLVTGITFLFIGCLIFKKEKRINKFLKLYSAIGAAMLCVIAPQSLYFFFNSGGLGFGRFRSSVLTEIPYVWAYKISGDTFLFKTSTHGSYLLSFFGATLINSLILRYFKSDNKKLKLTLIITIFAMFFIIYINQYVTATLILALNALLASIVCYYYSNKNKLTNLIPIIISILLIVFTFIPFSKVIPKFPVPTAQVDLREKLSIMEDKKTPNESVNRITLLYRSFLNLKEQGLLLKGIGLPVNINMSNHQTIEATRHTFGLDYLIYFGIFGGSIAILLKLLLIWLEPLKLLLNKPSHEEILYVLNVGSTITFLFLIGRLDYFKWSLLTILGLWLYPIIISKNKSLTPKN